MNFCIVVNPHSGKNKSFKIFKTIEPLLKTKKIQFKLLQTDYKGHAIDMANQLNIDDYDGIIIIGGDGTFHEIVSGLMTRKDGRKIPIGIIPGGSGNSFLYDLNIKDPLETLAKILNFKKRLIDVIEIKTVDEILYSISLVGWGFATDLGILAEKYRWLGPNRYTIMALVEIIKNKTRNATLIINNKKINNQFTSIIACNTKYVGKGMYIAPKASTNDSLLDLIVVNGNLSRIKLFKTLPKLFKGTHINDPNVAYYQVNNFSLVTKKNDPLNIDGELKGETPINVKVIPNAIEVFN